jgi:RNA polymerase sigma-70 factor (ECF subfamily)
MMSDMNESVKDIIVRAKSGDRTAFDTLHELYVTPVYRYVLIRLHNVDDTEDVVQETFMKAYQAIDRYEEEGKGMLPYLFTIARNLLINHTKKKRPETFLPEEMDRHAGGESASAGAIASELSSSLRSAMAGLSDLEREVIELKFFGERTYTEIAVIMEKREDAIRQHVVRAMRKLRVSMAQFE